MTQQEQEGEEKEGGKKASHTGPFCHRLERGSSSKKGRFKIAPMASRKYCFGEKTK